MTSSLVFAKPPLPGKTKSRLAAAIGETAAADFARAALIDNLAVMQASGMTGAVWHPPGVDPQAFGDLIPAEFAMRVQQGDDLGERMAHAIDATLAEGADTAIIIGADCVTHTPASLHEAAALAAAGAVVCQPATDGGFVLIASSQPFADLLDGLPWGGSDALAQVQDRCAANGREVVLMSTTSDVDVADDLPVARDWVNRHRPAGAVARWFAGSTS